MARRKMFKMLNKSCWYGRENHWRVVDNEENELVIGSSMLCRKDEKKLNKFVVEINCNCYGIHGINKHQITVEYSSKVKLLSDFKKLLNNAVSENKSTFHFVGEEFHVFDYYDGKEISYINAEELSNWFDKRLAAHEN
jgi:hypothetical protein